MLSIEKLYHLLEDSDNPAWRWFPNNEEMLKLANYLYSKCNEVPLDNGVYMQTFAVKDGVRYDTKIISIQDASKILTTGLMDGMQKVFAEDLT